MNGGPLVTTADSREHLVSQPCQIRFQVTENHGRGEVSRERLVPVQEVLRIPAYHHINRMEQSLQITVLIKGRTQIRHDDIPHEHHSFVGKINQHGIMRFTPSRGDQLELRSADAQVRSSVDRNVRFVAQDFLRTESLSKELLRENVRTVE